MTSSTLAVAVCCSKVSVRSAVRWRSSLRSRAFSMAMAAWSAKVRISSICRSVNGSFREGELHDARWITLTQQRHADDSPYFPH